MNEFYKTYFYIETGYVWGYGHTEEQSKDFDDKMEKLFKKLDWELKEEHKNGVCATYKNKYGISQLYCHPMSLSGVINILLKEEIEEAIKEVGIELRFSKTFEKYENISKEQLIERILNQKEEIKKDLFEIFRTSRTHLYKSISLYREVARKYYVNIIGRDNNNLEENMVYDMLQEMITDDLIVIMPHKDNYCRALNKTELKEWKKLNK